MYGHIDISREKNCNLTDKAGREGFITNKAYREFQDDLIQFFIDLASRFFYSSNEESSPRSEQLSEIQRQKERILEAEKKRGKLTKVKFTNDLKNNQQEIEDLENDINKLYSKLAEEIQKVEIAYNEYNKIVSELESKKTKLRELKLIKPKRINLSPSQEKKYAYYQESFSRVYAITESCDGLISETRKRFDIQNLKLEYVKRYESNVREISGLVNDYRKKLRNFLINLITTSKQNRCRSSIHLNRRCKIRILSL